MVVAQFEKFVIPKRSFIARGICFGPANSRFLTGKERRFGMTKCNAVQTEPLSDFPLPVWRAVGAWRSQIANF